MVGEWWVGACSGGLLVMGGGWVRDLGTGGPGQLGTGRLGYFGTGPH